MGYGTFKPIQSTYIQDHQIHEEIIHISEKTSELVNARKKDKNRIFAVGTTVARALETSFKEGHLVPGTEKSQLYIYPGYQFSCVDCLITNFHLPGSTLIMLVAAILGVERTQAIYAEAVRESYRFFSYGDAMIIL